MNLITLKNDGSFAENDKAVESDPLMFLSYQIDLGKGYTLRSFFRMFEKYALLAKLNPFLPDCLQQYLASPNSECISDEFDYLQFGKTIEMIGFPGEPRLEIYHTLCGVRDKDTCELKAFHMQNLLDIPLKLDSKF